MRCWRGIRKDEYVCTVDWGRLLRSNHRLDPTADQPNPAELAKACARVGLGSIYVGVRRSARDVRLVDVRDRFVGVRASDCNLRTNVFGPLRGSTSS